MRLNSRAKVDWPGMLAAHCHALKLPNPERERAFHPARKWKLDLAWPGAMLAAEVDGAVFTNGAHTRGLKFTLDTEKLNTALLMGWRVFRFTTDQVRDGSAAAMLAMAFTGRPGVIPMRPGKRKLPRGTKRRPKLTHIQPAPPAGRTVPGWP